MNVTSTQHSIAKQDSGTKHDTPDGRLGILVSEEQSKNIENGKCNYHCPQVNCESKMNGHLEALSKNNVYYESKCISPQVFKLNKA